MFQRGANRYLRVRVLWIVLWVFSWTNLLGQPALNTGPTRILFMLDASGSMSASWDGASRMDHAKQVLIRFSDSLNSMPMVETGLRTFGSISLADERNCKDTRLETSIRTNNAANIRSKLDELRTRGITPIGYALERAQYDFPRGIPGRNIIILITDGLESCDADPCAIALELQKKGIILRPFIIGIGIPKEQQVAFECMGTFFDAGPAQNFSKVMGQVLTQAISRSSTQINLLDASGKATETNKAISLLDHFTGQVIYEFVHTLNSRGQPDTLYLDPVPHYDVLVHTTPSIIKKDITLKAGAHSNISIPAAQGNLELTLDGKTKYRQLSALLIKDGEVLTTVSPDLPIELLAGTYDLEILSLPRTIVSGIQVRPNQTTTVRVPSPGILTLLNADGVPVFGSIYREDGRELEWITRIEGNRISETLTLQPGAYRLVYRNRASKKTLTTRETRFRIRSGESKTVDL